MVDDVVYVGLKIFFVFVNLLVLVFRRRVCTRARVREGWWIFGFFLFRAFGFGLSLEDFFMFFYFDIKEPKDQGCIFIHL
ncbi:MAG TPA: hypothetical protein PKM16_10425, partial [Bacteroidia bacterium]|nr:hypothetical protein [Bacteroidia bacterium]